MLIAHVRRHCISPRPRHAPVLVLRCRRHPIVALRSDIWHTITTVHVRGTTHVLRVLWRELVLARVRMVMRRAWLRRRRLVPPSGRTTRMLRSLTQRRTSRHVVDGRTHSGGQTLRWKVLPSRQMASTHRAGLGW